MEYMCKFFDASADANADNKLSCLVEDALLASFVDVLSRSIQVYRCVECV